MCFSIRTSMVTSFTILPSRIAFVHFMWNCNLGNMTRAMFSKYPIPHIGYFSVMEQIELISHQSSPQLDQCDLERL